MVQVTPFLLVLNMALVAPGFSERECVLEGQWINSMGHRLIIGPVNQQGRFNGMYIINGSYLLTGFQRHTNQTLELGFTVCWSSVYKTIFKGRCFVDYSGNEVLKTTWVLMKYVNNQWIPIRSGTYYFFRMCTCKKDCPGVDFNAEGNNWDADPPSCTKMCQCSQEKFDSAGDFETDGSTWDADPISGSTISGSTTCF